MMLGDRFDEAFKLASSLHREQTRKSTPIPYISHPMAVAGIVLEANAYLDFDNIEDIAIGALLHDAIEDQGHQITLNEIRQRFGDTVHRIVSDCSDAESFEKNQEKAPWRQRKDAYISRIRNKPRESILVASADKLHNARSLTFDYDRVGQKVWERFNAKKEDTLWYYESLCDGFSEAWPENPLLPDLRAVVSRLREAVHSG